MTPDTVEKQVKMAVNQSLGGQEIENPKVECKSKWYLLDEERGLYSFLKDCTAIANTVGLDGFIIIGYNDREKKFYNANFSDCGLRDTSDLYNILARHVDAPFDIAIYNIEVDSNILNVLHIPPSLHKPHVIRLFKYFKEGKISREERQRIFVRKNTAIFEANKYDLDLMYYDRKNIFPEYEMNVWLNLSNLRLHATCSEHICTLVKGGVPITLENSGRRSVSINIITMTISLFKDSDPHQMVSIRSLPGNMVGENYIAKPQDIKHFIMQFESNSFNGQNCREVNAHLQNFYVNRKYLIISNFVLHTTHERALIPRITLTN